MAAVLAIGGASAAAADHLDDGTDVEVNEWPTAEDDEISAAETSLDSAQSVYPAVFWGGDDDGFWGGDGGFWGGDDSDGNASENESDDDRHWNESDDDHHRNDSDDESGDDDAWSGGFWDDVWGDDDDDDRRDDDTPTDTPGDDEPPTDTPGDDDDSSDDNETNRPPDAAITAPGTVDAGETVVLSAAGSTDDSAIASYEWALGADATASSENVTHSFAEAGNYTVTLTVTDDEGATDNATATIQVENASDDDGFDEREVERRMHERINEIRQSEGLEPLNHDEELRPVARGHSEDMAVNDYFSHTSPDGDSFVDRYDEAGYDCSLGGGENIAMSGVYGEPSEEELANKFVDMWMNSTGHRENILTERWRNEGIGVYYDSQDGEVYATQNFC